MKIKELNQNIKKIVRETGFNIDKEIYRGVYYSKDNLRNIIYSGVYQNKLAILKFYDDPRITDEPTSLYSFLKSNKSKIITAPKIYKKEILSASRGWFIAEKIPVDFSNYNTPLDKKERKEFLNVYLEYRKNFPKKPTRKLLHLEKLSPDNFHVFRINRWFELTQKVEAERMVQKKSLFLDDGFIVLYEKAIEAIRKEFKNRKMIWCHGHFKPHEIFTDKKRSKYYLIDLEKVANSLGLKKYKSLLRVSLMERVLGTILTDITASDRTDVKKKNGIKLMKKLLEEIL